MFGRFIAGQLNHPSGYIGAHILPRLWNRRNAALNDAAFEALELQPDDLVLEAGFGGGYLLQKMANIVTRGLLAGVDVSPAMVGFLAQRGLPPPGPGRIEICCASAESLPFRAGRFTKICSVNSLFYWPDLQRVLAEFARVLAARGQVVLCFTCAASLKDKSFARHGVTTYEDDDVARCLEASGLTVTRRTRASDRHREFLCVTAARAD